MATLSYGAQRQLELALALVGAPRLLLLDEPAAGLNDIETGELARLLTSICASGVTILLVEHNMRLVMGIADQVIALEAGSIIAAGPPALVQRDQRVIDAYLGAEPVA